MVEHYLAKVGVASSSLVSRCVTLNRLCDVGGRGRVGSPRCCVADRGPSVPFHAHVPLLLAALNGSPPASMTMRNSGSYAAVPLRIAGGCLGGVASVHALPVQIHVSLPLPPVLPPKTTTCPAAGSSATANP